MSGSWTIDKAIKSRWDDHALDALFRSFWPSPATFDFHPFCDTEQRPLAPMPYCVFEAGQSFRTSRSTGGSCESEFSIEYWTVPVQFSIYARTLSGRSGKDIAIELMGRPNPDGFGVLKAFDDSAGNLNLDGQDRHIQTHVEGDILMREDDDVWKYTLMLNVDIERRRLIRGLG
jgi:hypothetical protein